MSANAYPKFLILWLGELVSGIGSGLTAFALGVYVFQTTHSAAAVSLVTLCAFLPMILLNPLSGVLSDRYDRRVMMMLGEGGSAIGLLFILAILSAGDAEVWQICVGVALSSAFASLTDPAYKATITDLLTEEQYARASGLVQLAGSSKYLLSPVIAGFLLGFTDIKMILLLDICTFFFTMLTLGIVRRTLAVRDKADGLNRLGRDLSAGWQCIIAPRGVFHLTLLLALITFFMGLLQTLFTPLVLPLSNTKTLGIVESVSATGLLAGSLFIGGFNLTGSYSRILAVSLGFSGLFFALLGISADVGMITIAGFLFFAALPFVNTCADVLIRKNIPNEAQGRAWGVIGVISQLGYVAAYAVAGILADRIFNPLIMEGGALASSVGRVIGTGEGRGIGFMFIVSGAMVAGLAVMIGRMRSIRELQIRE